MSVNLGTIRITPNQQAVTAQPTGTNFWGNIWDVVKTTAGEMVKTGSNILLQKMQTNPPVTPSVGAPTSYPAFAPTKQSPEVAYDPSSLISRLATALNLSKSPIIDFVSPVVQPAVSEGIREGIISVANRPPVWVWVGLGLLGVVIVMQGVKR